MPENSYKGVKDEDPIEKWATVTNRQLIIEGTKIEHLTHLITQQVLINCLRHGRNNQGAKGNTEWRTQTVSQVSVYKRKSNKNRRCFQITVGAVNATEQRNLTGSLELAQGLPWLGSWGTSSLGW